MKIAVDVRSISRFQTGIGVYLYNVLYELQKIDKNNEYILVSDRPFEFPLSNPKWSKKILKGYGFFVGPLWLHLYLYPVLKNTKADLFMGQYYIPLLRPRNMKTLVTIHDLTFMYYPEFMETYTSLMCKLFVPYAIKHSNKIVCVSKATEASVLKEFPKINKNKIHVVLLANDVRKNDFKELDLKELLEKHKINRPFILSVGTFEPRKNLITLFKAFEKIENLGYDLIVCGAKGWKNHSLSKYFTKNTYLGQRVHFITGATNEEISLIYKQASIFVYPSLYEGFGIPVLEAMAAKLPVICSDTSSLPEVAGDAALYFKPTDSDELASKIAALINDQELVKKMKLKSIERLKNFSWEKSAEALLKVINGVRE